MTSDKAEMVESCSEERNRDGGNCVATVSESDRMSVVEAGMRKLCSDATLVSGEEGFFKTFDRQVVENLSDEQFKEFSHLEHDGERVFFVWNLPMVHSILKVKRSYRPKSASEAERCKRDGNIQFQNKRYKAAVNLYNQTIAIAPSGDLLALGYANRSAALYYMEKFQEALSDAEMALSGFYPNKIRYKLYDRMASCYSKLGQVTKAKESLQNLMNALDCSEMDDSKLTRWKTATCSRLSELSDRKDFIPIVDYVGPGGSDQPSLPLLPSENQRFSSASAAVDIGFSTAKGRHAVATQQISTGEVLVVARAYASFLINPKLGTHCTNCLKRVMTAFPCLRCSGVIFCSRECLEEAQFHNWECQVQLSLVESGMSPLSRLALRLITKNNMDFFNRIKPCMATLSTDRSEKPYTDPKCGIFDASSYLSLMQLVTLSEQRSAADMLHRTLMAVFLVKTLRVAGYFSNSPEQCEYDPDGPLSEPEIFIGGLLLRHLQFLQFNAHEVGEYVMMQPKHFKQSRSINIGVAVYPTVCFFNHSCEGGIARSFVGDTMVVRSVGPINPGDAIHENYGPIFTHKSLSERQQSLKTRYWFECQCQACSQNWRDYDNMDSTDIRYRCQSCTAILINDAKETELLLECAGCHHKTNIHKINYELEKIRELYQSGMHMMHDGETMRALRVFYRFVDQCHRLVAPPYRELSLCQEAIRMCVASTGSMYVIKSQ